MIFDIPDEDQSVSPNPEFAVAESLDQRKIPVRKNVSPVIDHHKIVACSLIFIKCNFHSHYPSLEVFGCFQKPNQDILVLQT
jgi:hypothetical protein